MFKNTDKPLIQTKPHIRFIHFVVVGILILAFSSLYYLFDYARLTSNNLFPWMKFLVVFELKYAFMGILLCIPFLYSILTLKWNESIVIWLISLIVISPHIFYFQREGSEYLRNYISISMPFLIMLIIKIELSWRNKERQTLKSRDAERQNFLAQIYKTQEEERKRIARELHDDTTQTALAIANRAQEMIKSIDKQVDAETLKKQAGWIRDTSMDISESVRRLSLDLRPGILDLGLLPALTWLVDRVNADYALDTQIQIDGVAIKLPPDTDLIIFRFVQEALSNVKKHSRATRVKIKLSYTATRVVISIEDNGIGFKVPEETVKLSAEGKLGILGMQERAKLVGGNVEISSLDYTGTKFTLTLPVSKTSYSKEK